MQRSRRGYKQHRPFTGHRKGKGQRSAKVQHVRVSRGDRQIETGNALADAAANMTPEQLESWREKIKRDK